jgi:hypothetical protein
MLTQEQLYRKLTKGLPQKEKGKRIASLHQPCIIAKKIHDIMFPRATWHNGKWYSYITNSDIANKIGLEWRSFSVMKARNYSVSATVAQNLHRLTDGYITAQDLIDSSILLSYIRGDNDLLRSERERLSRVYKDQGIYIDELLNLKD